MLLLNTDPPSMEDLKIKFDGQTHQIEANTLINSLLHFTAIVQEVNSELQTGKKIEVKINALPEGSFLLHITVEAQNILEGIKPLFTAASLSIASDIVGVVTGIYTLGKFLRGKKPAEVAQVASEDDTIKVTNTNGDVTIFKNIVFNIYNKNPVVQEALSQGFETLENDPNVTGFELLDTKDNSLLEIPREEFPFLAQPEEVIETTTGRVIMKVAHLNIVKLAFDEKMKWEFYLDGNKISARIGDLDFLNRINKGEAFAKGDSLHVDLEITQEYDETADTYVNKSYRVNKILKHISRARQGKLDL